MKDKLTIDARLATLKEDEKVIMKSLEQLTSKFLKEEGIEAIWPKVRK